LDTPNHALRSNDLLASSLHFWWVAFLRSSKDFWWICQQNGKCHDERLIKIWEDFGDLYQYNSFPEPLHLDPKTISEAIFKLFTTARLRGSHFDQDAKYQIIKSGNKKAYKSIKPAYLSNALKVCVDYSAEADPINRWGTYQVSKFLELCPQHHPKAGDSIIKTKSKQKAMRTKSSQACSMAAKLIANVEIGRFPSCKDVPMQARWTRGQEADLKNAVSCGQWQKSSWFESEHSFMLPEHLVSDTSFDGLKQQRCLNLLSDMKSVNHAS